MRRQREERSTDEQQQEDELVMFSAEFLYEGAKDTRGGKAKFRFHHEKRRKYTRYDLRIRSLARGANKRSRGVKQAMRSGRLLY